MPTIEELLRESLFEVTKKNSSASKDLHDEVVKLATAVQSVSNGAVSAELSLETDNEKLTNYSLLLFSVRDRETRQLCRFQIPLTGYPIVVIAGSNPKVLKQKEELKDFFSSTVADKGSDLVTYIAYLLRKNAAAGDIPF